MVSNKNMRNGFLIALGALLIDTLFHYFFTTNFETDVYFVVKVLIVFILGTWVANKQFSVKHIAIGTLIFVTVFSIYYRVLELFFNLPFGARVPDIVFGSTTIIWTQQPYLSILLWGIIHSLAFAVPVIALKVQK